MDYLFIAVKNLSNKEIQLLRKRIDKQTQKLKVFNLLYENDEMEMTHSTVMEHMGYSEKPAGFYTLKNRLHEDVMEVRMEIEKNEVILTKEKVQSLRGLVHSPDAHPWNKSGKPCIPSKKRVKKGLDGFIAFVLESSTF